MSQDKNAESPWVAGTWGSQLSQVERQMGIEQACERSTDHELWQLSFYLSEWLDAVKAEVARRKDQRHSHGT